MQSLCDLAPSLLCGLFSYSPLPSLIEPFQNLRLHLFPPWGPPSLELAGFPSLCGCMVFIPQTQPRPLLWRMPRGVGWGGEFESPRLGEVPLLWLPRALMHLTAHLLAASSLSPLQGALLQRRGSLFSPALHTWQNPWVT